MWRGDIDVNTDLEKNKFNELDNTYILLYCLLTFLWGLNVLLSISYTYLIFIRTRSNMNESDMRPTGSNTGSTRNPNQLLTTNSKEGKYELIK